jgi:serine/threonine-protein kinase
MSIGPTCPRCGHRLDADAPRGLCPACLLCNVLAPSNGGATDELGYDLNLTTPHCGSPLETDSEQAGAGPPPRIRLPETPVDPRDPAASLHLPPPTDRSGRYELLGEIDRGGMGAVLRGRDPELGRELAIKVLLERHRGDPALVRRFVEEARIGGQLQHPGIVPVYEFGAFSDARPYFTMRLVEGRTLKSLLEGRKDPDDDRPRSLAIFEQVAQTVAYAHARGVIHRDLKPSNVMVGSFGEVQVMDWGLAKRLDRADGVAREAEGEPEWPVPEDPAVSSTRPGSVVGTPSYMAPEQARGEVDLVDERADVFGLGAILCQILTGTPPYCGTSLAEVMDQAARGDTTEALARLEDCGADAELVALARSCLASDLLERPGNAGDVARRMTAYLAGVQERLRTAERDRAVAEARAREEVKRRRVTLALAASVLMLVVVGGGVLGWSARQRERQAAQALLLTREAYLLRDQARTHADDPARWLAASEAVRRVEVVLAGSGQPGMRRALEWLHTEVQAGLDGAQADRLLRDRLVDIRGGAAEDPGGAATDAAYARTFASAGIDIEALTPAEAAARIARRPPAVVRDLVAALDHWIGLRVFNHLKPASWAGLLAIVRASDPDPDRDALRGVLLEKDHQRRHERLGILVQRVAVESWTPATLVLLSRTMSRPADDAAAVEVLRRATGTHPNDAWIYYELGYRLRDLRPPQPEEVIRAWTAARALLPESGHDLAHLLVECDRGAEAEGIFRDLTLRRPDNMRHLTCFGQFLAARGRHAEAHALFDRAVRTGSELIRLWPDDATAHRLLARALRMAGQTRKAAAEYRAAIRLDPDDAGAHFSLGSILCDEEHDFDQAAAEFRMAIQLAPDDPGFHFGLGTALRRQEKWAEATAECRKALALFGSKRADRRYPPAGWVAEAEHLVALDARLPAIVRGEARPADAADALALAHCCVTRHYHATAARLYGEAFAADATLADDLAAGNRYHAACQAAAAGIGHGRHDDPPPPEGPARAALRRQALRWLEADLTSRAARRNSATATATVLARWKSDSLLAGVRDAEALAKLPSEEQAAWRSFWSRVDDRLATAPEPHS